MIKKINKEELSDILCGSVFLGSGGGGSLHAGNAFVKAFGDATVDLVTSPAKLPNDSIGCVVCDIGSIAAFDENQNLALDFALDSLSKLFLDKDKKISVLFPIETGPENTLAPFVLASKYKLQVFDGDGAGRAIPTIPLCTFLTEKLTNLQGIVMANGKGDVMSVTTPGTIRLENLLRDLAYTSTFSSSASLAMWPNTAHELAEKSIQGVITSALHCGKTLKRYQCEDNKAPVPEEDPLSHMQAFLIAKGEVVFKKATEKNAFNFTVTKVKNQADGTVLTVLSQNENLIVFTDSGYAPVAIAPDSICWLSYNFFPLTNAEIFETSLATVLAPQYVYLIGIKAYPKLMSPAILEGFQEIIRSLGYAGKMSLPDRSTLPLSVLLKTLYESDNKSQIKVE